MNTLTKGHNGSRHGSRMDHVDIPNGRVISGRLQRPDGVFVQLYTSECNVDYAAPQVDTHG